MTSPRQRKKKLAILKLKEKLKQQEQPASVVEKVVTPVATPAAPVVESAPQTLKSKKAKAGLVELKPQDQVVEQPKEEVKSSTGE